MKPLTRESTIQTRTSEALTNSFNITQQKIKEIQKVQTLSKMLSEIKLENENLKNEILELKELIKGKANGRK